MPESDPSKPGTREGPASNATSAAAGGPGAGSSGVTATPDRTTNTIRITQGTAITLNKLSAAVDNPAALRELAPGEWLAAASIEIDKGASVTMAAPDVRWLKLRSVGPAYAGVKVFGGGLAVIGSCITSWDDTKQQVDANAAAGRSFLLASDGAQMTIDKAQLAYLGFCDTGSYGLSWRTNATGGHIADSDVSICSTGCTRSVSADCPSPATTFTTTRCTASTRTPAHRAGIFLRNRPRASSASTLGPVHR
ncbi:MAG: hypothetical protein JOY78_18120 [Pseudonocardia sp.]|nr:hypothetical protein [Pseudonocardia sp.]